MPLRLIAARREDAATSARHAPAPPLRSALYRGWVRHRRNTPRPHDFRYPLFLVYLDLSELDRAFRGRLFWSVERPNLVSYRRADYLGPLEKPLDEAVRDRVERELGTRPRGPIRLLTSLRTLGLAFNPVSFYYCFEEDGETLAAVLAEITNTPWGERHVYVVGGGGAAPGATLRARFPKRFHVSPFFPMDQVYDWRFTTPGERLAVHMRNLEGGRAVFDATLSLERRPLSSGALAAALLRHPFTTGAALAAIYWQAARLWWKRTPFFAHPAPREAGAASPVEV